ncbi:MULTISPECIES: hypothetical protein [unclassified Microcoleus]|uniref:hypothetical protein n=1 Tax=unclassified Microcoleus TaxID=2642155 RepID=UPI002FD45CF8
MAACRDCGCIGGLAFVGRTAAEVDAVKSAIACVIVGIGCSGFSLFGYFDKHVSYCNKATNPCTPVVVTGSQYPKNAKFVKLHQGWGLLRTASGVIAAISFGAGYFTSGAASVKQRKSEEEAAILEARQKQLEATTSNILDEEEIQKTAIAADLRVKDFKRELYDGYNTLYLEKNPELLEALTAATPQSLPASFPNPIESKSEELENAELLSNTASAQNNNQLLGVELPVTPKLGVKFFDWKQFRDTPEMFPHIRGVAATRCGKTTLFDWLMDVMPSQKQSVITVKRWPHQWLGLDVIGVPEDYQAIRSSLEALQSERVRRTALMAKGIDSPIWNVAVDEWKAISRNVRAIVDRKTKQIISLSAKQIMGEMITLARETNIRIFALAQGRQVVTWGLEGESDLAECFCSIYMGKFAVEECESYRNKFPKDSEQYAKYQQVRDYLESLGNRAAWISCELGEFPAVVPDLSGWKREVLKEPIEPITDTNKENTGISQTSETDDPEQLWELAKQRLEETFKSSEIAETGEHSERDTQEPDVSVPQPQQGGQIPLEPLPDKEYPILDGASLVSRYFSETTESALFEQVLAYLDTSRNASDIIKNVLKCTKPDKDSSRSYSSVGKPVFIYLVRKYGTAALIAHFADFLDK